MVKNTPFFPPPMALCSFANLMSVPKVLRRRFWYQWAVGVLLSTNFMDQFMVPEFHALQRALWMEIMKHECQL